MAVEKNLTRRQAQCDLQVGLDCLEEMHAQAARCRARLEETYGPACKSVLREMLSLYDSGIRALQNYLETFHPEAPNEPSPEGRLLRPEVPEWRPGPSSSSSLD